MKNFSGEKFSPRRKLIRKNISRTKIAICPDRVSGDLKKVQNRLSKLKQGRN